LILLSYNEIGLKKDNRWYFEKKLMENIRRMTAHLGLKRIENLHKKFLLEYPPEFEDQAIVYLQRIYGIHRLHKAFLFGLDQNEAFEDELFRQMELFLARRSKANQSFKVETKRINKNFPRTSVDFSSDLGGRILDRFPGLKVDIHQPDFTVYCEIYSEFMVFAMEEYPGPGGLPSGTGGEGLLLISGGIDSPVAGWLTAKRGLRINAIHFLSPPHTSPLLPQKIRQLCEQLALYQNKSMDLYLVSITPFIVTMMQQAPREYLTLFQRRVMLRLAARQAKSIGAHALITGDNLGQVASQTIENIAAQEGASEGLPIIRPLITYEKYQIIQIARQIETYPISIQPIEDCCSLFVPRHPVLRAYPKIIRDYDPLVCDETMIQTALESIEKIEIRLD